MSNREYIVVQIPPRPHRKAHDGEVVHRGNFLSCRDYLQQHCEDATRVFAKTPYDKLDGTGRLLILPS